MLNDSNREPITPLTEEEFDSIRKTILAEAEKLVEDFKSRGLLPAHLVATAGVLLSTFISLPEGSRTTEMISVAAMQAIGEIEREKASKVSINQ